MGGLLTTPINVPINLNENNNAGNTGILNLNGGVAQASFINGGGNNTYVNFNGGTLEANQNQGTFMTGLKAAYVFGPGGTINNDGFNIVIGQPFTFSPTTNGIHGIATFTGGLQATFPRPLSPSSAAPAIPRALTRLPLRRLTTRPAEPPAAK